MTIFRTRSLQHTHILIQLVLAKWVCLGSFSKSNVCQHLVAPEQSGGPKTDE